MNKLIAQFLKFLLFLGVGLGILFLLYKNQNAAYQAQCIVDGIPKEDCNFLQKLIDDFKGANYFWIALVLLVFAISNISRAIRWNMLLKPMGYRPRLINSFLVIIVAYFANLGLPRIGEVVRGAMISRYENIPLEKAMGTIVTDRIVDVLSLLFVVALAFVLEFDVLWGYLSSHMGGSEEGSSLWENRWLQGILGIGILGAAVLWFFRQTLMNSSLALKIKGVLSGFGEGLRTISKLENPGWFIFHSLNIWAMYFLMTYFCFFAYEPTTHLGLLAALMVFVFGAFGIVIPSPGGMGSYHFLVMAALSLYGIGQIEAFSFANILFFSVQIGSNVLLGGIALLLLPLINRHYSPRHISNKKNSSEKVLSS